MRGDINSFITKVDKTTKSVLEEYSSEINLVFRFY